MERPKDLNKLIKAAEGIYPADTNGDLYVYDKWKSTYPPMQNFDEVDEPVLIETQDREPIIWGSIDDSTPDGIGLVTTNTEVVDFIVETQNLLPELLKYIKYLEENQK